MNFTIKHSAIAAISTVALGLPGQAGADEGFTIEVGGRAMLDYAIADADTADLDLSASEARRIRLNVSGQFGSNLKYKAELNTNSSGEINAEDVYLDFKLADTGWKIKAGQFKTPNSLDEANSSRFMSTIERAAFTDAFELNRRVGVMAHTEGDRYTFAGGIFGENLEADSSQEGFAVAARGTFNPVKTDDMLVHLGASARYREIGDDASDLRYRQRPYTHIPSRVVSTGRIAEKDTFYGIEAAAIMGRFWAAGEYGLTGADTNTGGDANLDGFYIEGGVFFGGKKTYSGGAFKRAKVDNPITDGGLGALALVARYDTIDLSESNVSGGQLDTAILGVDWWPTKQTRLRLNYFNGDVAYGASTSGLDSAFAAEVTAGTVDDNANGLIARLGFDF